MFAQQCLNDPLQESNVKERGHVDSTLVFTGEFFKATAFKTHYLAEPVAGGKNSVDMFAKGHSPTVP